MALLILAASVWMAVTANRREIDRLKSRIAVLRPNSRELVVADPRQFAAVKRAEGWYDENGWDVYIPDGSYRLCLATREIDDKQPGRFPAIFKPAPVIKSLPILPGRHRVELEINQGDEGYRIAIVLDGTARVEAEESKAWGPDGGSSGGSQVSQTRQMPADQPLNLFLRRFMRRTGGGNSSVPAGPTEGVQLWIERSGSDVEDHLGQPALPVPPQR